LVAQAAQLPLQRRARAPLFLPYLSGERTPHNNPRASGVFAGLRQDHGSEDIGYAVMEGVGFGLKDGLAAMQGDLPASGELALVGGGARSDFWAQLLASSLGCRLRRPGDAHAAAAKGAARLAWLANGGDESRVCVAPAEGRTFAPDEREANLLRPRYARFRALYPALESEFVATARIDS
jgi:xylulokinase